VTLVLKAPRVFRERQGSQVPQDHKALKELRVIKGTLEIQDHKENKDLKEQLEILVQEDSLVQQDQKDLRVFKETLVHKENEGFGGTKVYKELKAQSEQQDQEVLQA
jgi:hypothetical protein